MYSVIVAEKPSVAASIAYCVGATDKVKFGSTFYRQGNGYIVTNALGHLIGLGIPENYGWDKWELEQLPLIPEKFKLLPIKGYSEQIELLKSLFNRDDVSEIINACDAGREGECIFRYIYDYLGCKKPVKRLWISSLTDESIKDGMKHLLDGKEKESLFTAGYTRAKADWILGMSLSRLYSILDDNRHRVGRVKTPVLNIIAKRDEAIDNFVSKPYFKVLLANDAECERTFDNLMDALAVVNKCKGKTVTVTSAKSENKAEQRPLLHSLTSLQREANDLYGMTAAETLDAAQSLYEKKLLTYPRTDSNYLTDDMIPLVESIVKCLSGYDSERIQKLQKQGLYIDKRIIDNSKVSDHHALIPTNLIGRLENEKLTKNENNVINLVINRFLCALDKPYTYIEYKYEFMVCGEVFKLTVKTSVELGWRRYSKMWDDESVRRYICNECDTFTADEITVKDCETTPPKRFTESSLLSVMENIDRLIDDKELKGFVKDRGLGTPATRASIIEELISAGYIQRRNKQLISTEFGRNFVKSLPDSVKSAELTARWERMLTDIENGKVSAETLLNEICDSLRKTVEYEKSRNDRVKSTKKVIIGKCPRCGSPVIENAKAFSCSKGKEACGFAIFKESKLIGRQYTASEIYELLTLGRVTLNNCTSSKGNKYSAVFGLEDTGKYVNFKLIEFVDDKRKRRKFK
ncbi:MAG: DNA topoisomerase III [Ruminiclostridium sp.]|nr:DNA topoisomerase III [Ruminiclostridium sp.]